jgi:adenine phosphoribosyltransferase
LTSNTLLKSATERLKASIRDVPDFPKPGIVFKDITPILQNGQLFRLAVTLFSERYQRRTIDTIVAIDARGFLFASALAYCLGTGIAIVRKKGKLPYQTIEKSYDLEYGQSTLQIHTDALQKGQRVIIIDDVLATGGTVGATVDLVRKLGAEVLEACFLVELGFLNGREKFPDVPVFSVVQY